MYIVYEILYRILNDFLYKLVQDANLGRYQEDLMTKRVNERMTSTSSKITRACYKDSHDGFISRSTSNNNIL